MGDIRVGEFGDASIDEALIDYIREILPEASIILELGSGWGTTQLTKHWEVISIEHDKFYFDQLTNPRIHAPLVKHKPIRSAPGPHEWYDRDILTKELRLLNYDLLLIDGPPGGTRSGIIKYIDLFDSDTIIVFDDLQRKADRRIINSVAAKLEKPYVIYTHLKGKPFGVINDPHYREKL